MGDGPSSGPVHVFVDFSNFWWPLTNKLKENDDKTLQKRPGHQADYDKACDKVFESLSDSVQGDYVAKRIKTALCVGSVPPGEDHFWDQLKAHRFTVSLSLRATDENGKAHENAADATLHAQILAELCDPDKNPVDETNPAARPTLVLLTGDGNANEGLVKSGFTNPTTFPMCVQRALRLGWHVKQYAWSWSCNKNFKELQHKQYKLVFLDDCKAFAEQFDFKKLCKAAEDSCKFFGTPQGCKHGDMCKFSHDSAVTPVAEAAKVDVPKKAAKEAEAAKAAAPKEAAKKAEDSCKFFGTPQGCKHGDMCKFSHDSAVTPVAEAAKVYVPKKAAKG